MARNSNGGTSSTRVLRVLKALRGHTVAGVSNKELAETLHESPANIHRALAALIDEGLVTKLETGRFAHSIQLLQIAQAHAECVANAQARLNELNQRIVAGARG